MWCVEVYVESEQKWIPSFPTWETFNQAAQHAAIIQSGGTPESHVRIAELRDKPTPPKPKPKPRAVRKPPAKKRKR